MTPTVLTGAGSADGLAGVLARSGWTRAVLVTTPGRRTEADRLAGILGGTLVVRYEHAAPHVPVETVADAMQALGAVDRGLDVLVALGGGSAIGLAKAIALETSLPIVALPTTFSGSEMTSIWGLTEGGTKRTGRDPRVAPRVVVYDPVLAATLPADVSAASGMNAMAHAVEALYASNATEAIRRRAENAAAVLAEALPPVVARPGDLDARARAFAGAHDAGVALAGASMGLHHRLCHVLGGRFGLPHARTHAALLPHVTAFNAPAAPEAMARLASALEAGDPAEALFALNRRLGLRFGLRDLGLTEDDLDEVAAIAADGEYPNPRRATAADVRGLLEGALGGDAR